MQSVLILLYSLISSACECSVLCFTSTLADYAVKLRPLYVLYVFFFLMIRRPPRSTLDRSSAASDVYKRQRLYIAVQPADQDAVARDGRVVDQAAAGGVMVKDVSDPRLPLSLIHISEPTRPY